MLNIYLYISTLTVFKAISKLLKNYNIHTVATLGNEKLCIIFTIRQLNILLFKRMFFLM